MWVSVLALRLLFSFQATRCSVPAMLFLLAAGNAFCQSFSTRIDGLLGNIVVAPVIQERKVHRLSLVLSVECSKHHFNESITAIGISRYLSWSWICPQNHDMHDMLTSLPWWLLLVYPFLFTNMWSFEAGQGFWWSHRAHDSISSKITNWTSPADTRPYSGPHSVEARKLSRITSNWYDIAWRARGAAAKGDVLQLTAMEMNDVLPPPREIFIAPRYFNLDIKILSGMKYKHSRQSQRRNRSHS